MLFKKKVREQHARDKSSNENKKNDAFIDAKSGEEADREGDNKLMDELGKCVALLASRIELFEKKIGMITDLIKGKDGPALKKKGDGINDNPKRYDLQM